MIYLQLFLSFLQVGAFSVGGGYAAMPMIQGLVVDQYGWLTLREFADLVSIAEMTPGPIAVNAATFVGLRLAGLGGVLIATLGVIAPSLVIVSLLSWLYTRYRSAGALQTVMGALRPAVVALIASAGLTLLLGAAWDGQSVRWLSAGLFAAALTLLRWKECSPILVMIGCGAVNFIIQLAGGMTL
ncbi:MAG: chromate transporter [Eubacteriales bacterium]|nr:chromate transporter [Eubacteriales bacterium]